MAEKAVMMRKNACSVGPHSAARFLGKRLGEVDACSVSEEMHFRLGARIDFAIVSAGRNTPRSGCRKGGDVEMRGQLSGENWRMAVGVIRELPESPSSYHRRIKTPYRIYIVAVVKLNREGRSRF